MKKKRKQQYLFIIEMKKLLLDWTIFLVEMTSINFLFISKCLYIYIYIYIYICVCVCVCVCVCLCVCVYEWRSCVCVFWTKSVHSNQWWPKTIWSNREWPTSVRSDRCLFSAMVNLEPHYPRPNLFEQIPVLSCSPSHGHFNCTRSLSASP